MIDLLNEPRSWRVTLIFDDNDKYCGTKYLECGFNDLDNSVFTLAKTYFSNAEIIDFPFIIVFCDEEDVAKNVDSKINAFANVLYHTTDKKFLKKHKLKHRKFGVSFYIEQYEHEIFKMVYDHEEDMDYIREVIARENGG